MSMSILHGRGGVNNRGGVFTGGFRLNNSLSVTSSVFWSNPGETGWEVSPAAKRAHALHEIVTESCEMA